MQQVILTELITHPIAYMAILVVLGFVWGFALGHMTGKSGG